MIHFLLIPQSKADQTNQTRSQSINIKHFFLPLNVDFSVDAILIISGDAIIMVISGDAISIVISGLPEWALHDLTRLLRHR